MIKDRSLLAAVFYNINITLFSVSFYVMFEGVEQVEQVEQRFYKTPK